MDQPRALVPLHEEIRLNETSLPFSRDLIDLAINNRVSGNLITTLQHALSIWSDPVRRNSFIGKIKSHVYRNDKPSSRSGLTPKLFESGSFESLIMVGVTAASTGQEIGILNLKVVKLNTGDLAYLVYPNETDRSSDPPILVTKDRSLTIHPDGAVIETLNPANNAIKDNEGKSELKGFITGSSKVDPGKELYLRIKNVEGAQPGSTLEVCMIDLFNPEKQNTEVIQSFQLPQDIENISHIEASLPNYTHADEAKYIAFEATKNDGTTVCWLTEKSGRVIQQFSKAEYSSYSMVGTVEINFKNVADIIEVDSMEQDASGTSKKDLLIVYPSGEKIRIAGIDRDSYIKGRQIQEAEGIALPTIWYWQGDNLGIFDLRTRKRRVIPLEEIKQAARAENIEIGEGRDDFRFDRRSEGVFSINGGILIRLTRGSETAYVVSSLTENTPLMVIKDKTIRTDTKSVHISPNADAVVLGTIGEKLSSGVSLQVSDSSSPVLQNIELPVSEWLFNTKIASMYGSEINRRSGNLAKVEFNGDEISLTVLYTVPTNKRNENDEEMEETTPKFTFARTLVISIKNKELKHEYLDVPYTSTIENAVAFHSGTIDVTTYSRNNIYLDQVDREFPYFANIRLSLSDVGFNPENCHIQVPPLFQVN